MLGVIFMDMESHFRHISRQIIDTTSTAKSTLKIAVAWFTNDNIFDQLLTLLNNQVSIELIVVNDAINNRDTGLDFNKFISLGGHFYFANSSSLMHHKFAVVDTERVISGSYNWTYNAEYRNTENIIISSDISVINGFLAEFERLKASSTRQIDSITIPPSKPTELNEKAYLKADLVCKSYSHQQNGDIKKSKEILERAKEIQSVDTSLEQTIKEIEKNNTTPEYHYHVEDGQFSFDYYSSKLLGKEGQIIKVDMWGDGEMHDVYILFIDGFYIECIGNIERSFPKTKDEHEEIKKFMIDSYSET